MFTHIVFFKLKDKANIQRGKELLLSLDGKIPFLREIKVGEDVVHSERSYDIALITKFDSREDMDKYQVHPVHVNDVVKYLKPMLESSVSVDFEE
ncbi:Dabb family protein [Clostridium pasteurianum]|uniref:Stress responsive A/B Barrel Domain-containing protein n=1 Tax=Clostridium pasteurianum BC1 TaxID=86416 RepID=R4K717_CLOPA|nr:Dabb family protein [Clostridium pasteurianum]AGK98358.1 Stress responsive A/B Barrel Domain-containing protein [Clostridium pasteurianum BC1]